MERYFTTKIYWCGTDPSDAVTGRCVDVQLTPYYDNDLTCSEVSLYWTGCVKRRKAYRYGRYIVETRLTRCKDVSFSSFEKMPDVVYDSFGFLPF